ncbi:unnamed protein product [Tilletia controversa]|nr:unnamed protein product [Tilletia controversa]
MLGAQRRQRLNLVSDAPVPGPGSNLIPNRRWILSRQSPLANALPPALTGAAPPQQRSYLAFFARTVTVVVVGVAATLTATKYAIARIAEIQRGISQNRRDSDNLRKRFAQNQEDCTFTILALLPTLDAALAAEYDVDAITRELSAKPAKPQPQPQPQPQPEQHDEQPATYAEAASSSVPVDQLSEVKGDIKLENAPEAPATEAEAGTLPEASISEVASEQPVPTTDAPELSESTMSAPVDLSFSSIQEAVSATADPASEPQPEPDTAATQEQPEATPDVKADADAEIAQEAASDAVEAGTSEADAASGPADAVPAEDQAEELPTEVKADDAQSADPSPENKAEQQEPEHASVEAPKPASALAIEESAVLVEAPEAEAQETEVSPPQAPQPEAPPAPSPEEILAQKRRKAELWNELKLVAFTRTLTTLYSIVLLSLQTHIQLNLVGRFNYLSSVTALANATIQDEDEWSPAEEKVSSSGGVSSSDPNELLRSVEQRYLTYSWWLLHRGALQIGTEVEAAVKHVLGTIPLKAELSLAELHRLVREVRRIVEWERVDGAGKVPGAAASADGPGSSMVLSTGQLSEVSVTRKKRRRHFLGAMFPTSDEGEREILAQAGVPTDPESELDNLFAEASPSSFQDAARSRAEARLQRAREDAQLAALVNESKDWVDSDDFERVLALSLERVFAVWETNLAESAFGGSAILSQEGDELERERLMVELSRPRKVRLAALLPAVNAQSRMATHSVPNEYTDALADVKELRALSALIYSSWST